MSDPDNPRFRKALAVVLDHEGGFVDDRDDPGGATNHGVSLRWLRTLGEAGDTDGDGDVDTDDIRALEMHDVVRLYHERWWVPHGYDSFPDSTVAIKTFDLAVNMGSKAAHRVLQRAIRASSGEALIDDGMIGPVTRQGLANCEPASLLAAVKSEAAGHYRLIAATKPRMKKFLRGWLNRAYS